MTSPLSRGGLVGRVIGGRFELVEQITAGGMAELYRGGEGPTRRAVAVKVLRRGDPELTFRFRREADVVSRLRCPHTVALCDFGEDAELLYIAMEHLVGETLFEATARRGVLPIPLVIDIGEQV